MTVPGAAKSPGSSRPHHANTRANTETKEPWRSWRKLPRDVPRTVLEVTPGPSVGGVAGARARGDRHGPHHGFALPLYCPVSSRISRRRIPLSPRGFAPSINPYSLRRR